MRALNDRFGYHDVGIDTSVHNPARIWKLYSTMARKGDHTNERPHRRSYLFSHTPKIIDEVPILSIEKLKALADRVSTNSKTKSIVPRRLQNSGRSATKKMHPHDLGSLNVEIYLDHYGIKIKQIKERAGATFFCLDECIFDGNHRGGEAAIVASPTPPHLTYQCFHDSCQDKKWRDARACISGDDAIAQFFSNYDPDWKPIKASVGGLLDDVEFSYSNTIESYGNVPSPDKIDPKEFFQKRGRREVFTVALMAKYLALYLAPICHTDGVFWKYSNGLWAPFKKSRIDNIVHYALKDYIQTAWYKSSRDALSALTNREEEEWGQSESFVNLANGIYDLEKSELIPHNPNYDFRSQVPTDYAPQATCERWLKFLDEIFEGDPEKQMILQEFLGYVLMPTCRFEKARYAKVQLIKSYIDQVK